MEISCIVCAYNEEKNIGVLLQQIVTQTIKISQVLVVSSGSIDRTNEIVDSIAEGYGQIKLITQPKRLGKVSAVNLGLGRATGQIVILCSADVQLEKDTFERLVAGFSNEKIGMIGAHPIPTNNPKTFVGFCSKLVWTLHHEIALKSPKCGEVVAFRNLGYVIPEEVPVDEAYLEWKFVSGGYGLAYAPDAIVHNHGPETIGDYINQRKRNHVLHFFLKKNMHYSVSTSGLITTLSALVRTLELDPIKLVFTWGAIKLECISVILGAYDFYIKKNNHKVWKIVETTKVVK